MRHRVIAISLLVLVSTQLAACGQKGPLVLPTRPATSAITTPAPATSVARPASAITPPPASATRGD
ncbi:MAG TPA: lipoprotein [Rhodanobacteraceae bacterium]